MILCLTLKTISFQLKSQKIKLIDYSSERFDRILIGMTTSQGLLFIPKSKYGVVFGASVFEKVFTSKIYSFDLGIQFSVGVKF